MSRKSATKDARRGGLGEGGVGAELGGAAFGEARFLHARVCGAPRTGPSTPVD